MKLKRFSKISDVFRTALTAQNQYKTPLSFYSLVLGIYNFG